ncbi:MAG: PqqD family protein [Lachnospiraceae bacterium]|nr:PqqD family protein [Lachnospiraceae bacterium]
MNKSNKQISRKNNQENLLNKIPVLNEDIQWKSDDDGKVTVYIENSGFYNRLAQKLFKKPRLTQIHLDDIGSFIWLCIDGKRDIMDIGRLLEKRYKEKANPLYERLAKYIQMLEGYRFISFI